MQLTSRITTITPNGEWSNGQRTFNKYRVAFANGDNLSFLAIGDFKGQVGENLTYQKNENNQTGKVIRENSYQNQGSYSAPKNTGAKKEDTQTYIIRQSMIKAAIDYHSIQAHGHSSEEDIIRTARNFVTFINNG
jgi:hypothetical protein